MTARIPIEFIRGQASADGAGVRLTRIISFQPQLDPFLMLDEFNNDKADDYISGFPDHPHRGFETVTYMLEGRMLHRDHLGNQGLLVSGGVQWMTAGRGIIHSEMPQQEAGRMRGFQLWINLPAREKMRPAAYRDIDPQEIPQLSGSGWRIKAIAGRIDIQGQAVAGPVQDAPTRPLILDLELAPGSHLNLPLDPAATVLIYPFEGGLKLGDRALLQGQLARLGPGDSVELAGDPSRGARALLLAARPLGEPMVQQGPFVMNSVEEIEQAFRDYRSGRLTD